MRRSEYYDWIRATGYTYYVSANFALDNDRTVYCAPQRTARQGPVSREQITVLAMLLRHLRRAVALQQQLAAANAYAAVTQALITQRNEAVFLSSGQGHLLHSNPAADELLRRGATLRLANGGLRLRDPRAHRAHRELYRLIARIRSRQGSPGEAVGGDFLVRDSAGLPSHICRVNPVGAGGAALLDDQAIPRIMVLSASLGIRWTDGGREILGRHLGLTRRESEIALRLADGLSLP